MADDINTLKSRIRGAARARDFTKVQDIWIELAGTAGVVKEDLNLFLDIAQEVSERGDRELGGQLLLGLLDDMRKEGRDDEAFAVARRAAKLAPKAKNLREELVAHYRRVYAARPGLEGAIKRSGLAAEVACDKAVQILEDAFRYAPGDFCSHRSGWGIGRVVEAHPETGQYLIDFSRRRNHPMDEVMARTALDPRDQDDLDALLWTDKERVKRTAEEAPLSLLKSALKSSSGKIQARDLREKLQDVLDKNSWTRFWASARKLAKDDPWIEVGAAPKSLITMRQTPLARTDEVAKNVGRAGAFSKKLEMARRELLALAKDATGRPAPPWLTPAIVAMTKDVKEASVKAHDRGIRLEFALFKLEAAAVWPAAAPELGVSVAEAVATTKGEIVDPETGEPIVQASGASAEAPIPASISKEISVLEPAQLPPILREMSVQEYRRRIVAFIKQAHPKDWTERLRLVVSEPAPGTFDTAVKILRDASETKLLESTLQKVCVSPGKHPDAYAALVRARFNGKLEGLLDGRVESELVAKAIQLLDDVTHKIKTNAERGESGPLKTAQDALKTLLSEKSHRALAKVIEQGSEGEVRRILQLVRQSPSLTPTIIRSAENFVVHRFPELLSQVVSTPKGEEQVEERIFTTRDGHKKMEVELHRILDVEMPEVVKEIGRALEFGDISENSELDAAREKQNRLAERAERVRTELERVTVIDPATVDTSEVRVGTRVQVKHLDTGKTETFTILGPWDVDEAHGVISHLSAIAKGLLGHTPGDTVSVLLPDGGRARYEVLNIERAVQEQAHA